MLRESGTHHTLKKILLLWEIVEFYNHPHEVKISTVHRYLW